MDRPQHGPADIDPQKRLAVLANATANAKELTDAGNHETNCGAQNRPPMFLGRFAPCHQCRRA